MIAPVIAPVIAAAVAGLDWARIGAELDAFGCATTGALLPPELCAALVAGYDDPALFRARVVMARHGFGRTASDAANTSITRALCRLPPVTAAFLGYLV